MSLLERLQQIPDPRSRRRREYPLYALLAALILAAAHGENSLRQMWLWGRRWAPLLVRHPALGLASRAKFPALGTFWYTLQKLPPEELEHALAGWMVPDAASASESRRGENAALQMLIQVGQRLRIALAREQQAEEDALAAALRLLTTVEEAERETAVRSAAG
ncbi:MAG: transposase family protein [Anaerolineae bacterium]|nr:transposase family protein [Anaerolineae bacterium]MDW8070974.1 transposase family protein [Anaerolineae bacterium]